MKPGFLLAIIAASLCLAADSPDPQAILQRARDAFSHQKSCEIRGSVTITITGVDFDQAIRSKLTIATEQPGKLRVERFGPAGTILISDGATTWNWQPLLKQYTTAASSKSPAEAIASALAGLSYPEATDVPAKLAGEEDIIIQGTPHHCYMIEMKPGPKAANMPPGATRKTTTIWVDEQSSFVLKMVSGRHMDNSPFSSGGAAEMGESMIVDSIMLDQPVAPGLFKFTPPADAKFVTDLGMQNARKSDLVGKKATEFQLRDLQGSELRLTSLRGKVVLLDFWATWCEPCQEEMPTLEKIHQQNKDLAVIGIDSGEDGDVVRKFVEKNKITFPILLSGEDRAVIANYEADSLPTSVIVDAAGAIRAQEVGYGPESPAQLVADLGKAQQADPALLSAESPATDGGASVSGQIYRMGGDVLPPKLYDKHDPDYTETARKARLQGTVTLSIVVTADGVPANVRVIRPLGLGLDENAIAAVEKWRFHPATKNGKAVAVHATIDVNFRMLDNPPTASNGTSAAVTPSEEPHSAEEAYRRGMRLLSTGHADDSIALLNRAVEMKPDWAQAWLERGHAFYEQKRYSEAIADYDHAIRLDPNRAGWYDMRGLAWSYSGNHERGIEDYTRAIEMRPDGSGAWYSNRGWAYTEIGQPEKALADLNKAIELSPGNVKAYENRAAAYVKLADYKNAIADYSAAIDLGPASWKYEKRAEAKLALGDSAGAEADRQLAAKLFPSAPAQQLPPAAIIPIRTTDPIDSSLPAPELISPASNSVFDVFPRRMVCSWRPSAGAASYILEWDYSYNGVWHAEDRNMPGTGQAVHGTESEFDFVGAQPGRWRVWPVNANGQRGNPSEWRTFRYTR